MAKRKKNSPNAEINRFPDKTLLIAIFLLVAASTVIVYSASSIRAYSLTGDSAFYFLRHMVRVSAGLLGLLIFTHLKYDKLKYLGLPLLIVSIAALVILIIPGMVEPIKGSRRFLSLAGQSIQPSEIAKFALILFMADSVARRGEDLRSFPGYVRRIMVIGITGGLIMAQPDFSTGMLVSLIGIYILY